MKHPGDLCRCGHSRNQHAGFGDGRCLLLWCRSGCAGLEERREEEQ